MATNLTSLDFDSVRNSLKTYLQGQQEFADYNFEGAGLSVILNLLAQTAHNDAYLANMIGNEMWLDSATIRGSVASSASLINYLPRSTLSAKAKVDIVINYVAPNNATQPAFIDIPRGTKFNTIIDEVNYPFVLLHSVVAERIGNSSVYMCIDAELVQGKLMKFTYNVSDASNRFPIVNQNVDLTTLQVFVKNSAASIHSEEYARANTIVSISPTDTVYYIEENFEGFYQIRFGDGLFGKQVVPGNVIELEYVISEGDTCNYAKSFTYASSQFVLGQISVNTKEVAMGGSQRETIDSIKLNAPRHYVAQDRAVSNIDYSTLLRKQFPVIDDITSWGGEEMTPPQYGRVMICIQPKQNYYITPQLKTEIVSFLKRKSVVTIIPEIIGPSYIYINIQTKVTRSNIDLYTRQQVRDAVYNTIVDFSRKTLGKFNANFDYSRLTTDIDNSNSSVENNETQITLEYRLRPYREGVRNYIFNFNNPLRVDRDKNLAIISSSTFQYQQQNCFLEDRYGKIHIFTYKDGIKTIVYSNLGSVDYEKGSINIVDFYPDLINDDHIKIFAIPRNHNVSVRHAQICLINENGVVIDVLD